MAGDERGRAEGPSMADGDNANAGCNVARRLRRAACLHPDRDAVIVPEGRGSRTTYRRWSFAELEDDSNRIARGLQRIGVRPQTRLVLLVRPSFDFISLVFGHFKAGVTSVLIDPGMGRRNLLRCLEEVHPEGFVAVPEVQALRCLLRGRFPQARHFVTVGRRWFWGGTTLKELRRLGAPEQEGAAMRALDSGPLYAARADDPAAVIFTTGSTGPPKGVLYRHGNFDRQVDEIQSAYDIAAGEIDVACFPLFALFNAGMGVATVVPRMDFTRPATVDPRHIVQVVRETGATQAFGSPAVWNRVGRYCESSGQTMPGLRRVLSAGAPVSYEILKRMRAAIASDGEMHTPYGATEALPVATVSASTVLNETAERTRRGEGVCVGRRFPGIAWQVIRIVDGPIADIADIQRAPTGEIGELIVRGDVVTRSYFQRPDADALGKIADGADVWHRMGDAGWLDDQDRFWFCGRVAHRVRTARGAMFTIPCEAIFNCHPQVFRTALVGVRPDTATRGSRSPGQMGGGQRPSDDGQTPVLVIQPHAEHWPRSEAERRRLLDEVRALGQSSPLTRDIQHFLLHRDFPVDIRHNAKIFREKLAVWAEEQLAKLG